MPRLRYITYFISIFYADFKTENCFSLVDLLFKLKSDLIRKYSIRWFFKKDKISGKNIKYPEVLFCILFGKSSDTSFPYDN